jgi:hypothetical protein
LRTLLGQAPAGIPAGEFRLSGDLAAGTEKVALRNYTLKLGELIESSGDAVVTLGQQPSAKGNIRFQTTNARQLASLLSGQPQPMVPASPLTLTTSLSGQDAIELPDLTLSIGNLLTVKGKLRVVPPTASQALGVSGQLKAESPNLRTLAQAISLPGTYPAQPFSTNLTLSSKAGTYHFENLTASIADVAQLQGNLALTPPTPKTDLQASGNLSLTGQNLQQAATQFGLNAKNIPANAFNASAQVQGQGSFQLSNLVVNLPQLLQATGNATITPGSVLNVQSKLNISQLNGNAFPACAAAVAGSNASPAAASKAAAAGGSPWSDAPLNLSALRTLGLDLNLAASGITCAAYPVTSLSTRLVNTPSQLDVKDTLITFSNGGSVNLTSKLEHAGTPALSLQAQITNLAVQDWVRFLAEKGLQLPLNGEVRLTAAGNTTRQMAQSLGGMVNLNASSGQLPYSNMLGQLTGLSHLVQGQAGGVGAGDGRIDSFKAAFMLTNGQADTTELNLSTGQGAMVLTGTGQIDLANWQLNYRLTPTIHSGKGLAVPIVARGSLSAPAISADPEFVKKLTARLATEGIKGALGLDKEKAQGLGGVVGDVLSGQGVSQESVGNLLQNVLGKKPAPAAEIPSPTAPAEAAPAANPAAPVQQLLQGILGQ